MDLKQKKRWIGLGTKVNILLTACILLISVGLQQITYRVHCRKVDSFYFEQAERAANLLATNTMPYKYVSHLIEVIETDEFQEVRARAMDAGNEEILRDWMISQPPVEYELKYFNVDEPFLDEDGDPYYTFYGNYKELLWLLAQVKELFELESAYLQYYRDGEGCNLADPDEDLFVIGSTEPEFPEFSQYKGNVRIPPTVYPYGDSVLCTTCVPLSDAVGDDEEYAVVAVACVDINMSQVVRERHWFLFNTAVFIVVLTLAALAASMLLFRQMATRPMKLLANGASFFAQRSETGFSKNAVVRLPIWSNDEIGDLYRNIQSMQERIVENAERLTRITAERERVNTELSMAREIQSAMLPNAFPPFPDRIDFKLYASMTPAKMVGGDFYDYFLIDDDHLCLLIADVSDKGIPAALFMMAAKILINYRAGMGGSPGEILTDVNRQISKGNRSKMFVTVWMGILDVKTGVLRCTNAGHEYPFLCTQDGRFRLFRDRHGIMLGVKRKAQYLDYELTLRPGDAIFVYTDGAPEANNTAGSMYGMERLEQALNRFAGQSPEAILKGVHEDIDAFSEGTGQFDDLTMLCLEYKGPEGK